MIKTEMAVITHLLGWKVGDITTRPAPYRGIIGDRAYSACLDLEKAGIGYIDEINRVHFIFKTYAMQEDA